MDAAGMVEFHRAIWEEAERGRENIDAADFRIPTAGTLWDFDCRFDMPSGTVQTHGDVVSYSFLSELPGAVDAPVLSVRCEAPQVPKIAEAELMAPPSSVLLTRSVRALPEMPSLRLRVPLREARRPRIRTALCNSQVWGAQSLQELAPNLMEFWLLYYSEHLGIDEIYLYDLDGSFGSVPLVQELRASGRVVYEPSFSSIPPFKDLFELEGYKTATTHLVQTLVQHHCWQQARQNADWVAPSAVQQSVCNSGEDSAVDSAGHLSQPWLGHVPFLSCGPNARGLASGPVDSADEQQMNSRRCYSRI